MGVKRWVSTLLLLLMVISGCTIYHEHRYNYLHSTEQVQERYITEASTFPEYYRDIKPIFEQRCIVCHSCYDAPCQLKLSSFEGLERGISKEKVYDGTRLLASNVSRLFVDATNTQQWRDKGFSPVLNEREQYAEANLAGSTLYQMLELKKQHPLPNNEVLPDSFDFSLNRNQQCSKIEAFDSFASQYPLWGMPYGLPPIKNEQHELIKQWLENGAKAKALPPLSGDYQQRVNQWESFFNKRSLKQQLVARYIYEHLFLAHLYFDDLNTKHYFRIVRSHTPPGTPIVDLATRRPFDAPGTDRFYYRLRPITSSIIAKTHMPYALGEQRMQRWQQLFFDEDYTVTTLPSYEPKVAANPFDTFSQLPVNSRYKFMLDEAQFTIMGFIKGPVCRGQVSLNVINDHFWVVFIDPDTPPMRDAPFELKQKIELLRMPAEAQSNAFPIGHWIRYSRTQKQHLESKAQYIKSKFPNGNMTLDLIWGGDGSNRNAALTIVRHFDSASVEKGLLGKTPKTAWVLDYSLLERIHYLLVAGFDVYGNVGHQLLTRLYMDFLRMEGEDNFLTFLPKDAAKTELAHWYRGAEDKVRNYVMSLHNTGHQYSGIQFKTTQYKQEFFDLFRKKAGTSVIANDSINYFTETQPTEPDSKHPLLQALQKLSKVQGSSLSYLPEQSILRINNADGNHNVYTLLINRSHSNVSSLFGEQERMIPEEQTLMVLEGIIGSYPNVFLSINAENIEDFTNRISTITTEEDYTLLLDRYAIRRSQDEFWDFSDWLHHWYKENNPEEAGILDFNRIENR